MKKLLKLFFLSPLIPILGIPIDDNGDEDIDPDVGSGQDEDEEGEEQQVEGEETEGSEKPAENKVDSVPLAVHVELKQKHKELRKKLAELEDKDIDDSLKEYKKSVKERWSEKFDEETANAMAEEMALIKQELNSTKKRKVDSIIDDEIKDLSEDDFFSDALNYSDKIKQKINLAKKLGEELSVEEAYLLAVGTKSKIRDYNRKKGIIENIKNQRNGPKSSANVASNNGAEIKGSNSLSEDDAKALKLLQQNQPDAGWDVKKYKKTMGLQ